MLEKMLVIAKEHAKKGQIIVRMDIHFMYTTYTFIARVFYSDDHIIDINQKDDGFKVITIQ